MPHTGTTTSSWEPPQGMAEQLFPCLRRALLTYLGFWFPAPHYYFTPATTLFCNTLQPAPRTHAPRHAYLWPCGFATPLHTHRTLLYTHHCRAALLLHTRHHARTHCTHRCKRPNIACDTRRAADSVVAGVGQDTPTWRTTWDCLSRTHSATAHHAHTTPPHHPPHACLSPARLTAARTARSHWTDVPAGSRRAMGCCCLPPDEDLTLKKALSNHTDVLRISGLHGTTATLLSSNALPRLTPVLTSPPRAVWTYLRGTLVYLHQRHRGMFKTIAAHFATPRFATRVTPARSCGHAHLPVFLRRFWSGRRRFRDDTWRTATWHAWRRGLFRQHALCRAPPLLLGPAKTPTA